MASCCEIVVQLSSGMVHFLWIAGVYWKYSDSLSSWFDNYRRLCRNYEYTFDSAEEMVKLTSIRMLSNKIK